jgi:hypothetical protein
MRLYDLALRERSAPAARRRCVARPMALLWLSPLLLLTRVVEPLSVPAPEGAIYSADFAAPLDLEFETDLLDATGTRIASARRQHTGCWSQLITAP